MWLLVFSLVCLRDWFCLAIVTLFNCLCGFVYFDWCFTLLSLLCMIWFWFFCFVGVGFAGCALSLGWLLVALRLGCLLSVIGYCALLLLMYSGLICF